MPVALAIVFGLVVVAAAGYIAFRPQSAEADQVLFQDPTDAGPDPFTNRTDTASKKLDLTYPIFAKTQVKDGGPHPTPFGGSGSNTVCKPELMIQYLEKNPDRLRAWAAVLDVEPKNVAKFIRSLAPMILKRDARVTNHSFRDGRAVPFQAILPAGTAVLVTKDGEIVARCRCGNPLREPEKLTRATCDGCPPGYKFPPPCEEECFERPCVGRDCVEIPEECFWDPDRCVPPCPPDDERCVLVCPDEEECPPPPCLRDGEVAAATWSFLKAWVQLFASVYDFDKKADIADPCPGSSTPGVPALVQPTPEPTVGPTPTEIHIKATADPEPSPTPAPTTVPTPEPTPVATKP